MIIPKHIDLFEQELKRRNFSYMTIKNYKSCLNIFFEKFKHKEHPLHIVEQDIRNYLSLFSDANTQRAHHSAIKKYFDICLNQKDKFRYLPYAKKSIRLPVIIDSSDIQKIIDVCPNVKHRAIILTLYGTGIRISELLGIKLTDIDGKNGVIKIIGKGNKQRLVTMNEKLYKYLQDYWREYKTKVWLFENDSTHEQYTSRSVQEFLTKYKNLASITSPVTPHKFRHSCMTNLLESGVDLRIIQKLCGHSDIRTTTTYTHVSKSLISKINSPINAIRI